MRHQVDGRKLGITSTHRLAMFRNMAASLISHGRIQTTLSRAKEMRRVADRMISWGKDNSLHAKRRAFDFIRDRDLVKRLFNDLAPAFANRSGGYTRIYQLGLRVGDAAKMAVLEYLNEDLLAAKVEGKIADAKAEDKKKSATKKSPKKAATVEKKAPSKAKKEKK